MKRKIFVIACISAVFSSFSSYIDRVSAQGLQIDRSTMMSICGADYFYHCKFVRPGGGRIINCLSEVIDQIDPACAQLVTTGSTCVADMQRFCADASPGEEARACMMKNREQFSAPCQETMAEMQADQ
jgi:hypothetical protein